MESGGHKPGGGVGVGSASGGGGGGDGGHLCHVCGYKYVSAHPSAKQRRAHRKNCGGKPLPAAAAEEAGDGRKLLLGEGDEEGGGGGGDGSGIGASDCGGGFTGSAQDVGNAVEEEGNAERSSLDDAGVQAIINRSTEECLISRSNNPSEVAPKANETEIQTEVAVQLSENAPPYLEDLHLSQPAITCDQHQDASASPCPLQPENGARFSSEFSADEISKLNVVSLALNAASGSAQTNAILGCPDDVAVTEEDLQINTIGKDKTSDDTLAKGSEIDSSYQEKLQTKFVLGHIATAAEKDPSADNFTAVSKEQTPSDETESKDQSGLILTSSIEQVSTIKDPVNLPGNKKSCNTGDTNGDDLFEVGTGTCDLEPVDVVKPQQQTDSTLLAADQLTIPMQTEIEEGQHCPDADGIIQDVSGEIGTAVGADVISAVRTADYSKNVCSSEVTMGDSVRDNASHASGTAFMLSQVDLVERSYPTSEENGQNESISADLTSHEINEVHSIDVEEKQRNEDITASTTSHEALAVCIGDSGENKQNEEVVAEASSHEVRIIQGTDNVEEMEQIKEVIAKSASDKIDVTSSKDIVEEKQSEVYVECTHELNVTCDKENVEEKKQGEEIAADLACEISMVNIPSTIEFKKHNEKTTTGSTTSEINMANATDNVEEQKQNEEITTDPTPRSPDDEDKKQNEDMIEGPVSHDIIVLQDTYNVKEKNEDSMSDPTSYKIDAVDTSGGVQEKKQNEEIAADPTSRGINEDRTSDPTSGKVDAESNKDDIEEQMRAADSSSHENNIPQVTDNAEKKQTEEVAVDPAPDKLPAAQSTDDVEENKQKEGAATKEINTTQGANDDQNEEITDKEMTMYSDKSHISLKALLSEKGMEAEAKEKKASTKDRVLSFRRRSSKDIASPAKPGSEQQDWNSPARLPVEKAPKGKKQQWMPFICCPSLN